MARAGCMICVVLNDVLIISNVNDGMISLVAFKGYYVKEGAGGCNYTNSYVVGHAWYLNCLLGGCYVMTGHSG